MDKARKGAGMKRGGDGITMRELDGGKWEVRWWEGGKYVRRRTRGEAEADAVAERVRKAREDAEKARKREEGIARKSVLRGDNAVAILNMDPDKRAAVLLAAAKMEAAGGSTLDLPEAAEEWIAAHLAAGAVPLSEAVAAHVKAMEEGGRAKASVADRRFRLGGLVEAVGDGVSVAAVTRAQVAAFVEGVSPASRPHRFRAARAFFRWAWARGMIQRSPMEGMPTPPVRPTDPKVLSPQETRHLLKVAEMTEPGMLLFFAVGVFAGLRPQRELSGLLWSEVDLAERKIYVPWGRVKTMRSRAVPISENLAAWLERVPKGKRKGFVAAYSREGFRKVVKGSGIEWQNDIMRHTRVSYRLAETGGNVGMVALEGGHSPDVLARHYANLRIPKGDVAEFWGIVPESGRGRHGGRPAKR